MGVATETREMAEKHRLVLELPPLPLTEVLLAVVAYLLYQCLRTLQEAVTVLKGHGASRSCNVRARRRHRVAAGRRRQPCRWLPFCA